MKKYLPVAFVLAATLACSYAGPSFAEEKAAKPAMNEAAMQEMMKLGAPSENHKLLEPLVGDWTYTVEMTMVPGAPAQKSEGASSVKWIMDGRFLQEESHGSMDMNGQKMPFDGLGIFGHDNMNQEFTSVWVDNMTTAMMIAKGQYDAATKTVTFKGEMSCPMTGKKNEPFRSELTIVGPDAHTYAMYTKDEAGKEFKSLVVTYTRKK